MPNKPCKKPCGLQAANRLRRSCDFAMLRQSGKRFATPAFVLYASLNPLEQACDAVATASKPSRVVQAALPGVPRLGVVASRRVGSAVKRNKGKRWAREVFRLCSGQLPQTTSVMVVLRAGFEKLTFAAFAAQLLKALRLTLGLRELPQVLLQDPLSVGPKDTLKGVKGVNSVLL